MQYKQQYLKIESKGINLNDGHNPYFDLMS